MFEGQSITMIAMAVGFVLAAVTIGRSLMRRTLFPRVGLKDFVISLIAGTAVIWLIVNFQLLGILAGAGLIVFLLLPSFLKIRPLRF